MHTQKKRPVNLNLWTIRFPLNAIVSILHRISGAFLCLIIPFLLWMLQTSLTSEESFIQLQHCFQMFWVKFLLWTFFIAGLFHGLAGKRHLLMDMGWWNSTRNAYITAQILLLFFIIGSIVIGGWLLW